MNCPFENPEQAQVLLDYATRQLDAQRTAALEIHMESCPACREFVARHAELWQSLDAWDAPPVSLDFDRRLYGRIQQDASFWDRLLQPFRPLTVRRGLPVAAAACLLLAAGFLAQRPAGPPVSKSDVSQVESVQPEQVEQALDAMEMLDEFSHHLHGDNSGPRI
jgi:anti-sigma factor RsiW